MQRHVNEVYVCNNCGKFIKKKEAKLVKLKVRGKKNNNGRLVGTRATKTQKFTSGGCFYCFAVAMCSKTNKNLIFLFFNHFKS